MVTTIPGRDEVDQDHGRIDEDDADELLRRALLDPDQSLAVAHLYAGDGIVRDSVPAEELAETEVKLEALLPLLA